MAAGRHAALARKRGPGASCSNRALQLGGDAEVYERPIGPSDVPAVDDGEAGGDSTTYVSCISSCPIHEVDRPCVCAFSSVVVPDRWEWVRARVLKGLAERGDELLGRGGGECLEGECVSGQAKADELGGEQCGA